MKPSFGQSPAVLQLTSVPLPLPSLQHGIAVQNPAYKELEFTPEICAMLPQVFRAHVKTLPPEITIIKSERWRIMSFDEIKLKLSTHDNGGGVAAAAATSGWSLTTTQRAWSTRPRAAAPSPAWGGRSR